MGWLRSLLERLFNHFSKFLQMKLGLTFHLYRSGGRIFPLLVLLEARSSWFIWHYLTGGCSESACQFPGCVALVSISQESLCMTKTKIPGKANWFGNPIILQRFSVCIWYMSSQIKKLWTVEILNEIDNSHTLMVIARMFRMTLKS